MIATGMLIESESSFGSSLGYSAVSACPRLASQVVSCKLAVEKSQVLGLITANSLALMVRDACRAMKPPYSISLMSDMPPEALHNIELFGVIIHEKDKQEVV
jgi:hypothetical protein